MYLPDDVLQHILALRLQVMVDDFLKRCCDPTLKPYVDNRLVSRMLWAYGKCDHKDTYKSLIDEVLETHNLWMHYYA